jgi:phospholipid transport system substrate-binding protein
MVSNVFDLMWSFKAEHPTLPLRQHTIPAIGALSASLAAGMLPAQRIGAVSRFHDPGDLVGDVVRDRCMPLRHLALFSVAALFMLASGFARAAATQEAPDVLLRRVSQSVLSSIANDPAGNRDGQARMLDLVEVTILPNVDFMRATAIAAGRSWRAATPDQQKELDNQFRDRLVFSIAAALSRGPYDRVDVEPVHVDPADEAVEVRSRVFRRTGGPIQLIYRMEKDPAGWKVDDVSIGGSWLVQSYKALFASEISRGGFDGLIVTLTKSNRQRGKGFRR